MTFRNFLKQPSFTDWLIAGFTLALVVVSACQFSAIDGQLTTMQGQLGAMEKQTGIMQRDQRSWIRIELSSPPFRADSAQVAVLHIINSGKIPAREIRAQFVIETVDPDTAPALNYAQPVTTFASGIIFPGGKPVDESVHRLRASSKGVNGPVVDEYPLAIPEIAKFNDKKLFFVAYGEIRYKDSFGDHWTHFCDFILSPAGGRYKGRTCTEYNAADNN